MYINYIKAQIHSDTSAGVCVQKKVKSREILPVLVLPLVLSFVPSAHTFLYKNGGDYGTLLLLQTLYPLILIFSSKLV